MNNFTVVHEHVELGGLFLLVMSLPLLVPLGVAAYFGHVRRRTFFVTLTIVLLAAAALEIAGYLAAGRGR